MKNSPLFKELVERAQNEFDFLPDKPEETPENTIAALWCKAAGIALSVEAVNGRDLPRLDPSQKNAMIALFEKRRQGMPVQYIIGRQRFVDLEMIAGPQALIPRKETEILGRAALQIAEELSSRKERLKIIDVCTGAGNIACLLASHIPNSFVYASDLSEDAVGLASENARFLGLEKRMEFRRGDLLKPFDEAAFHSSVDLLTCNPPYISSAKVSAMNAQISNYEPRLAFDGGPFGVKVLQGLINECPKFIRPGGWLAFEVGLGQGEAMKKRVEKTLKTSDIKTFADSSGNIRVIAARTCPP